MRPEDTDILQRIAASIADRQEIDWSRLEIDPSVLEDSLESIRRISRVAGSFRKRSLSAVSGDPSASSPAGFTQGPVRSHSKAGAASEFPKSPSLRESEASVAKWGPLELLGFLGEGSFGKVHRAFDPVLEREVALKLWRKDSPGSGSGGVAPGAVTRLLDEARRLAKVRHPGVVLVHGADVHDGVPGVWTERLEGESTEARLERGESFEAAEATRIAGEVCEALEAVHEVGLIHGDVKGENVYIEPSGRIVLLDFGSARESNGNTVGRTSATPLYAAPEVLEGEDPDPRADLYSLGAFLHRLLTGSPPLVADSLQHLLEIHRGRKAGKDPVRDDAVVAGIPDVLAPILQRSLSAEPEARYENAHEMVRALWLAESILRARSRTKTNLPERTTRFFGREEEVSRVRDEIAKSRWITLVGAGGSGKTRLALEATRSLVQSQPEGVWWIDLAPLRSASAIPSAILGTLGLADRKKEPTRSLFDGLQSRALLLVLDNGEHLATESKPLIESILEVAPSIGVLLTSRVPLGSDRETVLRVPPLRDLDDSIRLFEDRARKREPGFDLSRHRESVERICRALEGIPLAIEIAAARSAVFSPAEILKRLKDPLTLADGRAERPQHRSLRASIQWSYDLLSPSTQALFRRLSIFLGGWSAAAAEYVAREPSAEVLEGLATLVEHSLVDRREDRAGPSRFSMLETVRVFAEERLFDEGESEGTAECHWDYFLRYADSRHPELKSAREFKVLRELRLERSNLDRALSWGRRRAEQDEETLRAYARLLSKLRGYWTSIDARGEGIRLVEDAIASFGPRIPDQTLGHLHLVVARLAIVHDFPSARASGEAALELLTRAGDESGRYLALYSLALLDNAELDAERAESRLGEALAGFERLGDESGQVDVLERIGQLLYDRSRLDEAEEVLNKAQEIARGGRGSRGSYRVSLMQGSVAWARQDFERAKLLFEECLLQVRGTGDPLTLTVIHFNLGNAHAGIGDEVQARLHWEQGARIAAKSGYERFLALCQVNLAVFESPPRAREMLTGAIGIFLREGDPGNGLSLLTSLAKRNAEMGAPRSAVRLFSAGHQLRESLGLPLKPVMQGIFDRAVEQVRGSLPPHEFEENWRIGATFSLEEATEYAKRSPAREPGISPE